ESVNATGPSLTVALVPDLAASLIPGTLGLDGVSVSGMTQLPQTDNLLSAFNGREVSVARGSQTVKAKVLDASRNLFQLKDGSVFTASASDVTFPDLNGVRLNPAWQFSLASGGPAVVSYLTRALAWQPRYDLSLTASSTVWHAWADVSNQSSVPFSAPRLELVAGQVNLATPRMYENFGAAAAPMAKSADVSVQPAGESAGLRLYQYAKPVTLGPRTVTSVPFAQPHVSAQRLVEYRGSFSTAAKQTLNLARVYDVTADDDLPAGTVTIRDEGRVVGQDTLPDTTKDETQTLTAGTDFDLRLTRTVSVLENTRAQARYRVSFSLVNTKTRPVTLRLVEGLSQYGRTFELSAPVLPNLKRDADGFTAVATLAPSARLEASYEVTYKPVP
ncbi:MAG TPA: hypothetical protein VHN99_06935, partial [Deinococcales bacterium]|nr:hypothetical protein [Deinococcales bacterium]